MKQRALYSLLILLLFSCLLAWLQPSTPAVSQASRWQKISPQGQRLTPWQGPWACVWDKQNKRLWEVKTDNENIHDGYWSYSWWQQTEAGLERGAANLGDCYFESTRCDSQDLVRRANQQRLCNVAGWRLPQIEELQSLLQSNDRAQQAKMAVDYFPHIKAGDYWSADHSQALAGAYQHLGQGALAINFYSGDITPLPYRNAAFVLLVSDQAPAGVEMTQ
ncbi:DUF1566 domain-containing protein [Motilimonas pumila]|uniref:DUF1566 domain-containing protein n=1 Tax=Motilimonas pumila TaxID=2303987 RepID=A0A418YHU6_9GAMM|nr:DUF1566 domain-containing protein [Motilimonas pumila]RJG49899.1 DUF1566 domain-containing protein [Motilimonas pumila]